MIVITGASGGLGASTLAAVTAAVLTRESTPTLVDTDFGAGGLDATLAVEHLDGLRWGDLGEHEGQVDATGLRRHLPHGPVPVLAAGDPGPEARTIRAVIEGLAHVGPVVVDVPRRVLVAHEWLPLADVVVVLVGLRPRWLRDGERLTEALDRMPGPALMVTRGPRRAQRVALHAAEHLGLPLLDHLPDDPSVVRDEARGRAPRPRGAAGKVARALVAALPVSTTMPREQVLGLVS